MTVAPTVIVTGGSSGIGLAVAKRLLDGDHAVLITGRNAETGSAVARELGPRCAFVEVDHAQPLAHERVVAAYERRDGAHFGPLAGLVNNAGRRHNDLIGEHTAEALLESLALNTVGAILMSQAVVPLLEESGGGSIVSISSRLATVGMPGVSGYAASKAALHGFSVAAAIELAPRNIRVNVVAPGMTKTPLIDEWFENQPDAQAAELAQTSGVPLGRLASPEDVAGAVTFLLSSDAEYLTGMVIPVDGGYTAA